MNKYTLAGLLTGMPMIVCALMGLIFLHNIAYQDSIIFNQLEMIIWCIVFFFSIISPFIFGKIYTNYNKQRKNKKE